MLLFLMSNKTMPMLSPRLRRTQPVLTLLPALLIPLTLILACASSSAAALPQEPEAAVPSRPTELFDIVRVVDGDTVHIQRAGEVEKLRLLSVDTEEKLSGRGGSATKPETVYGEECALWAQKFFAELVDEGQTPQMGLRFPDGLEERDVYGRLLCHVILPDGRDFNLMLVELGKSPYFNKYGNSRICHKAFVAAQKSARAKQLGIWNPSTNKSEDPEAEIAVRPYGRLLPWWQARADAIDGFRERKQAEGEGAPPSRLVASDMADDLEAALAGDAPVEVFGQIFRIFDEDDGSRTVLFRATDKDRALRVRIAKNQLAAHAALGLDQTLEEFKQNYLYVKGALTKGERGFELRTKGAQAWSKAGPEPQGARD
ncbi:MAG: endonuclease YncB(thermonuclease family) [Planctomycetota bacterium]